jgi:Glycosyl hydrolase family 26
MILLRMQLLLLLTAWRSAAKTATTGHKDKDYYASCRPLRGQTYLTIGQDLLSVADYLLVQYNASLHESIMTSSSSPPPLAATAVAFMAYTDIQTLVGLDQPVDYGSGIEYADGLLSLSQSLISTQQQQPMPRASLSNHQQPPPAAATTVAALQIGLWLNGTTGCRDIVNGRLDHQVARLLHYLLYKCTAQKVFLRVGYEFDNPAFGYTENPLEYARAFRYIVDACRDEHVTCRDKIAFVWHSWAATTEMTPSMLDEYYPGDEYVDWIGVSIFSQVYPSSSANNNSTTVPDSIARLGSRATVETILDFAQRRGKPIVIAESAPFGGVDILSDPWNDWFVPVLEYIEEYDIDMWSYIHCDWDAQRMWHGVGFGDSRLSTNATVLRLWRQHVLRNPRFVARLDCAAASSTSSSTTTTATATAKHAAFVPDAASLDRPVMASRDYHRAWSVPALVLNDNFVPQLPNNEQLSPPPCTPCGSDTSATTVGTDQDLRHFQNLLWTVAVIVGLLTVGLALCGGLCAILLNVYVAVFGRSDDAAHARLLKSNKDEEHSVVAGYGTVDDAVPLTATAS